MGDRRRATEFYNSAINAANDKSQPVHLQHAYQLFSSAVFADATFGLGWHALGNANNDCKMHAAAVACWRRALQCDLTGDDRGHCMINLGWTLHNLGAVQEAFDILSEAVKTYPHLDGGWLNLGVCNGTLGKSAESVRCHRKSVELLPNDPMAQFGLGMALLYDAQYEEGYKWLESRFAYRLHQFLKYPYPKWEGEPDKVVFLVADQGLGDTLSYARFVEMAAQRAKFLHIVVQSELMRGFSQAWAHVKNINLMPMASPFLAADAWSTFVSLPFALGLTNEQVRTTPQITLPVFGMPTSWMAPDAKVHIGVSWAGSALNDINKYRSFPVEHLLELCRVPGVQLYSLQVDDRKADLQQVGVIGLIRDLSQYIREVTDTVSILRELDLVVTCESALGHICATAGKECWVPYSYLGHDYRVGHRAEHRMWTPHHRFFQQGMDQKWEPVFERITEALRERVDGRARQAQKRSA